MKTTQPNHTRIFYGTVLLLGLIWIGLSAAPAGSTTQGKIPAPQTGFLAPDFALTTRSGEAIKLGDLRGSGIILNIWATWCPPCRAEMPALERVYLEYKDKGLIVLSVNAANQDSLTELDTFVTENALTFPIVLDERGIVQKLYAVQSLPSTYFIGRDGIIREVVIGGPMSEALLRTRAEDLLKESR
jgi:peroxiredoxin